MVGKPFMHAAPVAVQKHEEGKAEKAERCRKGEKGSVAVELISFAWEQTPCFPTQKGEWAVEVRPEKTGNCPEREGVSEASWEHSLKSLSGGRLTTQLAPLIAITWEMREGETPASMRKRSRERDSESHLLGTACVPSNSLGLLGGGLFR